MALTDAAIRKAKPTDTSRKLADGGGLYVEVLTSGKKVWRLKYRFAGRERKLTIGDYPAITLAAARKARDEARATIAEGVDPCQRKQEAKLKVKFSADNTFKAIAAEYLSKRVKDGLAEVTVEKTKWLLSKLTPALGHRPVAEITPHELLAVLRKAENAGKLETAGRLRSLASRIFRYAVATGRASADPAMLLAGALVTPKVTHHAAITDPIALGGLMRAIRDYSGHPVTRLATEFSAHVFQRPGEIRQAEWSEIDFDKAVWTIPASRMKQRVEHHVPLSKQAVAILQDIQTLTGGGRFVFPSAFAPKRPMSENAVNQALRRMGYDGDRMTAHGFRSTASSLLNESGKWSPDAIERALSHKDTSLIRGVYHRAAYWDERVKMAQWWSDYLEMLCHGAVIVPFQVYEERTQIG